MGLSEWAMERQIENAIALATKQFEKEWAAPQEVKLADDLFITYFVTEPAWSPSSINMAFKAVVTATNVGPNLVNRTYEPSEKSNIPIPLTAWPDGPYRAVNGTPILLQGGRWSSEVFNAIMWYASLKKTTEFNNGTTVMDAIINATVTFKPPKIVVTEVEGKPMLEMVIEEGLIWGKCKPLVLPQARPKSVLKLRYSNLKAMGYPHIELKSSNVTVMVDHMDLRKLATEIEEPAFILPKGLDGKIATRLLSKMRPFLNDYLAGKPLVIPEFMVPIVAQPEVSLHKVNEPGYGYIEMASFCLCGSDQIPKAQRCSEASGICRGTGRLIDPPSPEETTILPHQKDKAYYETVFYKQLAANDSIVGQFLTVYSDSERCGFEDPGSVAEVYWLWPTDECSPIFMSGRMTSTFYKFQDGLLLFQCQRGCLSCNMNVTAPKFDRGDSQCYNASSSKSYKYDFPVVLTHLSEVGNPMVVANLYYDSHSGCNFNASYLTSQLLSTHTSIGGHNLTDDCESTTKLEINQDMISAGWNCKINECSECDYEIEDAQINTCTDYKNILEVVFTMTKDLLAVEGPLDSSSAAMYAGISLGVLGFAACVFGVIYLILRQTNVTKQGDEGHSSMRQWSFGLRCSGDLDKNEFASDITENILMISNSVACLIFGLNWVYGYNPIELMQETLSNTFQDHKYSKFKGIVGKSTFGDFVALVDVCMASGSFGNALIGLMVVIGWTVTRGGKKWTEARLYSTFGNFIFIQVCIAGVILAHYMDELMTLGSAGNFLTDNPDFRPHTEKALQVSIMGASLSVTAFLTIFFLFSIGNGLFCGTIVFRLTHMNIPTFKLNQLTAFVVVLTMVQPFVCLHSTVVWAQKSEYNIEFLSLTIGLWFNPVASHFVVTPIIQSMIALIKKMAGKELSQEKDHGVVTFIDRFLHVVQLVLFLVTFWMATAKIIEMEFELASSNVRKLMTYGVVTVVAVFTWFTSASYFMLSIALAKAQKDTIEFNPVAGLEDIPLDDMLVDPFLLNPSQVPSGKGDETPNLVIESNENGFCKSIWNFLREMEEYHNPNVFGWRVRFRRIYLAIGVISNIFSTVYDNITVREFSSKKEMQELLDKTGVEFNWPDKATIFDDTFELYNQLERYRIYFMNASTGVFVAALFFDFLSSFVAKVSFKIALFRLSRILTFLGGMSIFASIIILGIPNFLDATNVSAICPHCGDRFNTVVSQVAESGLGLFFATLFTMKLTPVLIAVTPSLIRATVLLFTHPRISVTYPKDRLSGRTAGVRIAVLTKLIQMGSFLTFPITFLSMMLVQQYMKSTTVTVLVVSFWLLPAFTILMGLRLFKKFKKPLILLISYYMFNIAYLLSLLALVFECKGYDDTLKAFRKYLVDPTFYANMIAKIFICNVIISDMLCIVM